jgi:hypothetical protein
MANRPHPQPITLSDETISALAAAIGGGGGGGGGATGGLTDAELRASAVGVKPVLASGGNLSVSTTTTGANWITLGAQACSQVTLVNDSGTKIEVRQGGGGVGLRIPDGMAYTFFGLANANALSVRRVDLANTAVTVTGRWA